MANLDQITDYIADKITKIVSTTVTSSELTTGTSTSKRVITPKVIHDYVDPGHGTYYVKLSDGTMIEWGSVTVASGSFTADWTHPVAFTGRPTTIQVTPAASVTSWNINYSNSSASKTNIGRTPNTSATAMYIMAIGKWK